MGDRENKAPLAELVRPPDAPPLLFLASYRRRDADASPFVTALREVPAERLEVAVDPLTEAEARELATALLGPHVPLAARFAEVIARESAGNPFLVHELVEFQSSTPDSTDPPTIETVVRTRLAGGSMQTRRLLEVVAAVGRTVGGAESRVSARPTSPAGAARRWRSTCLLSGRAVRTSGGGDAPRTVEPYHDRVREAVAADLSADVRVHHHRRLAAVVLTAAGRHRAPEVLAYHFARAGEVEPGGRVLRAGR